MLILRIGKQKPNSSCIYTLPFTHLFPYFALGGDVQADNDKVADDFPSLPGEVLPPEK